jgi:ATP/maltotriose-dependent transcriptional regulator MalT
VEEVCSWALVVLDSSKNLEEEGEEVLQEEEVHQMEKELEQEEEEDVVNKLLIYIYIYILQNQMDIKYKDIRCIYGTF